MFLLKVCRNIYEQKWMQWIFWFNIVRNIVGHYVYWSFGSTGRMISTRKRPLLKSISQLVRKAARQKYQQATFGITQLNKAKILSIHALVFAFTTFTLYRKIHESKYITGAVGETWKHPDCYRICSIQLKEDRQVCLNVPALEVYSHSILPRLRIKRQVHLLRELEYMEKSLLLRLNAHDLY